MRGEKGGMSLANRDGWSPGPPVVPSNWWKHVQTLGFLCWPAYGNFTIDTDTELESEGRESLPMVFVINAEMAHKIRILRNMVAVTEHAVWGSPESFLPTAWELNEWKSKRYEKHQWFLLYLAFPFYTHNKPSNIFSQKINVRKIPVFYQWRCLYSGSTLKSDWSNPRELEYPLEVWFHLFPIGTKSCLIKTAKINI